jgi:hypothetical protein
MEGTPNQGAPGEASAAEAGGPPWRQGSPASAGAPINQGAPGAGPKGADAYDPGAEAGGQSPLRAPTQEDPLSERPEVFVGAAFVGGFALAQILKRLGR